VSVSITFFSDDKSVIIGVGDRQNEQMLNLTNQEFLSLVQIMKELNYLDRSHYATKVVRE
jgi:hypothetical protein